MATILFVHGTGVRRGSYLSTFAVIQQALDAYDLRAYHLESCLWGDVLGATPVLRAVPEIRLKAPDTTALTPEQNYALWELLYRDPRFELRLLKTRPMGGPRPPTAAGTAAALWRRTAAYAPTDAVRASLESARLDSCWPAAWQDIIVNDPTARQAVESASEIGEPGQAVARAVVAALLIHAFEQELPLLNAAQRDALVNQLVDDWEARVAGIGAFLLNFVGDMAVTIATPIIKWRRGPLSEAANPAAGDVLRYQARGAPIRDYIRRRIEEVPGNVYLLAHSLGAIACVDLLAAEPIDRVKGLVTAGSQAPYLHEIGALAGLEPGVQDLPPHFPPWLNLYDPYDFLSYVAAPVFPRGAGDRVRDHRIQSGQPFPQSHSAYWTNPETWVAIRSFLA